MKHIFANMKPYWHMVIFTLILLVVQAYCDLALPQYTSDMIDTGIQNHGVEYSVPEKITAEEMSYSEMFMTDDEVKQEVDREVECLVDNECGEWVETSELMNELEDCFNEMIETFLDMNKL